MNELLFFITLIIMFSITVLANKLFGKYGLYGVISLAIIVAEIEVSCQVNMFGFPDGWVTLGNVAFATIFLCTDILNECYGYKESKKGVYIALFVIVSFLVIIQLDLLFTPSENYSFMHNTLKTYFGLDSVYVWITISSIICLFIANLLDVWLFEKIRNKTKNKKLWIRNNVATITSNCLENFLFVFLGYFLLPYIFTGNKIQPLSVSLGVALSTSVIEIVIGICDTPFVYLSKKLQYKDKENIEDILK